MLRGSLALGLVTLLLGWLPCTAKATSTLSVSNSYFSTSKNFDNESASLNLANGSQFSNLTTNWKYIHRFNSRAPNSWLFIGELITGYSRSEDASNTRTKFGLADAIVGAGYLTSIFDLDLTGRLALGVSGQKVSELIDEPLISEGAFQVFLGLDLAKKFKWANFGLENDYIYKSGGLASSYRYKAFSDFYLGSFSIGAELFGSSSVTSDENAITSTVRQKVTSKVNAGSLMFYAVNPSYMAAGARFGYNFDRDVQLVAKYATTLSGTRFARGDMIGLDLVATLGSKSRTTSRSTGKNSELIETLRDNTKKKSRSAQPIESTEASESYEGEDDSGTDTSEEEGFTPSREEESLKENSSGESESGSDQSNSSTDDEKSSVKPDPKAPSKKKFRSLRQRK
jgi:hypothetical protein